MRPTQGKVREALFNIIGGRINGADFLDLYAGSGAVGIEALSRGAASVTFVENSTQTIRILKKNLAKLPSVTRYALCVMRQAVSTAIPMLAQQGRKFDIIFIDPPYYKNEAKNCLLILDKYDIYKDAILIFVEHFKKDILPEQLNSLSLIQVRSYGDTLLTLYGKK